MKKNDVSRRLAANQCLYNMYTGGPKK